MTKEIGFAIYKSQKTMIRDLYINRKSNFEQFTNRIPLSLKFINRSSSSKVKCVIYKSQIRKSVIYKP